MSFLVDVKKWDAKLQITALPSLPSETSAKSYALTAEQSKTEDGGLELEFVLSAKPNSNSINIPFSKENIILFYQPPLTEEFKQEDCEVYTETHIKTKKGEECWRPENIVGSYAVYHASKRNNEYLTGKIAHALTPKLTDATGKSIYVPYNRDANETSILTIMLPQEFLDSAKYPVVVDPTFGYTSIGGTADAACYEDQAHVCKYACSEAGTVTKITAYMKDAYGTGNFVGLIYDGTPSALLAQSGATSISNTAGWKDFTLNLAVSATDYHLGFWSGSRDANWWYDSGATNQYRKSSSSPSAPPNPFSVSASQARMYSVYATYTTGATLQTVTDSLSLGDAVLRNKTLVLSDSLGLADSLYGNKFLLLSDSASLSELIMVIIGEAIKQVTDSVNIADIALTPSRVLQVLEAIGAADNFAVNKVLQITETVSLAEVVEVGVGGVKKTRLFLVLGDLAVQLTGD